jgi:hydrogenase maturation protease HycI
MGAMRRMEAWEKRLAKEFGHPERLAVLGVGNEAKGDDAAGVFCAGALARLVDSLSVPGLKIILAYDTPENFTGEVRKFQATHVLIIDVAAGGFPPGTLFLVEPGQIRDEDASTHRAPLSLLASYLEETAGCRVLVLGIEPRSFGPGEPLSPEVSRAVERAAAGLAAFARRRVRSSSASKRRYS